MGSSYAATKFCCPWATRAPNGLNNESDLPSKFRTRNWIKINDESRGNYANGDIKFKTTMLRSTLCNYANSYILVKGTITITGKSDKANVRQADERDKVTFKNIQFNNI